jgi:hypothetical protein
LCSRADMRPPRSLGSRPAGDHRQWLWLADGLVSILQFRYGLNAVHVDSRHAHVHRANFSRGRHGQESQESKENREGSQQEGGKEDFQEKEVISSTTNRLPPPGGKRDLFKGSEIPFAAILVSRQQKPDLCAGDCRSKVRFLFGLDPSGLEHLLQRRIVGKTWSLTPSGAGPKQKSRSQVTRWRHGTK